MTLTGLYPGNKACQHPAGRLVSSRFLPLPLVFLLELIYAQHVLVRRDGLAACTSIPAPRAPPRAPYDRPSPPIAASPLIPPPPPHIKALSIFLEFLGLSFL
jgi:hypothetical protein